MTRHSLLLSLLATLACSRTSSDVGPRELASQYLYQADRVWNSERGYISMPWDTLPDSDYDPVTGGPTYLLSFSSDSSSVVVARLDSTEHPDSSGTSASQDGTTVLYELKGGAGGRLIVSHGTTLDVEITFFGSGVPIAVSSRGEMSPTSSYERVGESCALPLAMPYAGYVPVLYADALANNGTKPVNCAGLRDKYCNGDCAGWLVADLPWLDVPTSAAYDPVTQVLVGFESGGDEYGICHGAFPPLAGDGSPGWNYDRMDRTTGCQRHR